MKFPYVVRHNGIDYPIGADVPIEEPAGDKEAKAAESGETGKGYSRTEINRMPIADLRALAESLGVRNAQSFNGTELKRAVIDFLNI